MIIGSPHYHIAKRGNEIKGDQDSRIAILDPASKENRLVEKRELASPKVTPVLGLYEWDRV